MDINYCLYTLGNNDNNETLATLHEDEVRADFMSMQIRIAITTVGSSHNCALCSVTSHSLVYKIQNPLLHS
jgi:hypothetical protein